MELFKLFGSIAIKNQDANAAIDDTIRKAETSQGKMSSILSKVGGIAAQAGKVIAVGIGAGATALTALSKTAIDNYADYEQLVGGVDTLFGNSAKKVIAYADEAYKTAGLSANEYMETVTSFSASLLQSLGGDTEKASEKANQAVIDMSDNANKMGTDMEAIQNAYQGFAKQNYTMLDNLKLGYGGTKDEMQRLLTDAEKISGIKYDLSSFGDIVDAIHVMQESMGIAGTTAKEASSTIQGSIGMMKSAWTNFLTGMADPSQDFDKLLKNLLDSVLAVADNLVPRIVSLLPRLVDGLSQLIQSVAPYIPEVLNQLLPALVQGATGLISAFVEVLPAIIQTLVQILPQLLQAVVTIFNEIVQALPDIIQILIEAIPTVIASIVQALIGNLPTLIMGLLKLVAGIVVAIPQILSGLFQMIPQIISQIVQGFHPLGERMKEVAANAMNAVKEVFENIWNAIKTVVANAMNAVAAVISNVWNAIKTSTAGIVDGLKSVIQNGFQGMKSVVDSILSGIKNTFFNIWESIKSAVTVAVDAVQNIIHTVFSTIHAYITEVTNGWKNIISGVWNAIQAIVESVVNVITSIISNGFNAVTTTISNILGGIQNIFGNVFQNISITIGNVFQNIGSVISNGLGYARDTIRNVLNGILEEFHNVFEGVKNIVGNAIDTIRSIFNFDWSLPNIKLPHFSINGEFSLNPLSVPGIGVEWYKKAMNEPRILTEPTIFGVNPATGKPMGGGEAGDEVVSGKNTLLNLIQTSVASENAVLLDKLETLIDICSEFFPAILEGMKRAVVLDSGALVGELAPAMDVELGRIYRKEERG